MAGVQAFSQPVSGDVGGRGNLQRALAASGSALEEASAQVPSTSLQSNHTRLGVNVFHNFRRGTTPLHNAQVLLQLVSGEALERSMVALHCLSSPVAGHMSRLIGWL